MPVGGVIVGTGIGNPHQWQFLWSSKKRQEPRFPEALEVFLDGSSQQNCNGLYILRTRETSDVARSGQISDENLGSAVSVCAWLGFLYG